MTVTVIMCAGQSNALGRNIDGFAVPVDLQTIDANIKIWNGTSFVTLQNGVNNDIHGSSLWGPEAEFARRWRLRHPADTLYVVKDAIGSSPLADDGSSNTWAPASSIGYFVEMETYTTNAKNWLIADGKVPVFEGLLWMQGETDATVLGSANAYQTNLTNFFSSVRSRWGYAGTKVMVGRITTASTWTFSSTVRSAQASVVSSDNGNSFLINTDSYGLQSDGIHYNQQGFVSLGSSMHSYFEPVLSRFSKVRFN